MTEENKKEFQNKLLNFLDNNSNLILIAILIFALILRLKYLTINQAVWYDEAEYLGVAKNWAFNVTSYQLHFVRPPFLPFMLAILYKLGGGETSFRILMLIFSIAGVLFTYLVGKEMFNKWIALIATFIMSFFYVHLFFSARIMTDIPSATIWLISVWLFWNGYVKDKSKIYLLLLGLSLILGTLTRFPFGLLIILLISYLLLTEKLNFLRNKKFWITSLIALITIIPYSIWYYSTYNKIPLFGSAGFYSSVNYLSTYLKILPTVFQSSLVGIQNIFLIFLIIGLVIIIFNIIIGYGFIRKNEVLKKQLFILLWTLFPFIYFAFFAGQLPEDRYLIYLYSAAFYIIGFALFSLYLKFKKINIKLGIVGIILILFILIFSSIKQIESAEMIIKLKSTSYVQFKQSGEWIKENSNPVDKVIAAGQPQLNYYAERDIIYWPEEDEIDEFIETHKDIKYIVLSLLEQTSQWTYIWPEKNTDKVFPVKVYMDSQQRPILIIYEIKR